jgi:peptide chain release factor 1
MVTAAPDLRLRLREIEEKFETVQTQLSDPGISSKPDELRKLSKLSSDLQRIVQRWRELQEIESRLSDARVLANDSDPDLAAMAREEIAELEPKVPLLEAEIEVLLLPKDPLDDKNIIVEIRAGTGGDEAALFAGDLLRLYTRYAERKGWKVELLSSNPTELNGFKEVIFSITGDRVYSQMKFEAGGHRVQRVPATEAQGRIHTSAATVAIMPEAEEVDIVVRNEDLRIDVYRSGGPGGQSVNTTDSAVRITHIPTGLVVQCQDEKSQIKNKAKALKVLRSRLLEREIQRQQDEQAAARKGQVGSGDRSERIRTYNFPQNRLTDHRINLTTYNLDRVMEGELDQFVEALIAHDQAERLRNGS